MRPSRSLFSLLYAAEMVEQFCDVRICGLPSASHSLEHPTQKRTTCSVIAPTTAQSPITCGLSSEGEHKVRSKQAQFRSLPWSEHVRIDPPGQGGRPQSNLSRRQTQRTDLRAHPDVAPVAIISGTPGLLNGTRASARTTFRAFESPARTSPSLPRPDAGKQCSQSEGGSAAAVRSSWALCEKVSETGARHVAFGEILPELLPRLSTTSTNPPNRLQLFPSTAKGQPTSATLSKRRHGPPKWRCCANRSLDWVRHIALGSSCSGAHCAIQLEQEHPWETRID
ncbi:hypothetical protein P154DRAFT_570464 [Amniculicola lignicola CBS 123094]|uniref:Uncharacterized protein n=1 Tax=Amniculicola lignicola CBS 123094 TaxID=1392246 RepID=A0A6A5WXT0_9PLEO|nr:hypothetical protein P154DRAFT_570464 [Amniculicola lignicola CBS 123094]